jgi:DNA helicase-2/ATP-dependent DNA helicase PcrA
MYEVKVNIPKMESEAKVNLLTAHKSKGLEFDTVFIINTTESDWGEDKKRDTFIPIEKLLHGKTDKEALLEDSRKLLYVAMTRAKKSLYMTFPEHKADGRENEVSGLVEEITGDHIEKVVVTSPGHQMFLSEVLPKDKVEFYRNLFLSESFSVTALNNYITCPNKYLFNNLLRFPFAMSLQLHVGNAVHSALEEFWMLLLRGKPHTEDTLYNFFERELRKKPIRERDVVNTLKKYKDDLIFLSKNFNFDKQTLVKPEFKLLYDYQFAYQGKECKISIKGSVDRVDDIGGTYVVTDFKTGEIKTRGVVEGSTKDSHGDYLRQIVFYRMIMELMDEKVNVSRGQVYFVLRDEKKKTAVYDFELTDELVSNLKVELESTFREIMSGDFLTKGCHENDCEFCKLRESIKI